MTQEEFDQLVVAVTAAIMNKSSDPGQYELAESLSGITSLPVLFQAGGTWSLKRALISLLKGADGREIELRITETALQSRYTDGEWSDLLPFSKLLEPVEASKEELDAIITEWNAATLPAIQLSVSSVVSDAETAIENANTAAENVKDGKTPVVNVVETGTLPPGENADVEQTDGGVTEDGRPIIDFKFKIPAGQSGVYLGNPDDAPADADFVVDPNGTATSFNNWNNNW